MVCRWTDSKLKKIYDQVFLGLNMPAVSLSLMISGDKRLRYVSLCGGGHSCGRSGAPMMSQVNRC